MPGRPVCWSAAAGSTSTTPSVPRIPRPPASVSRWEHQTGDGPYRGQRQIALDRVSYDSEGLIRPIQMTGTRDRSETPPQP